MARRSDRRWFAICAALAASLLPALSEPSRAQPPAQMERLTWTVGSRWTLTWKNSRNEKGVTVWSLEKIDDFEGIKGYFVRRETEWTDDKGKKDKTHDTQVRNMDLTIIGRLDDRNRVVLRRNFGWLKWPLVIGEQWTTEGPYEFLDRRGNLIKRRGSGFVFVKTVEDVTTPAGTFTAFHVRHVWRWFDEGGQALGHSEEEDWISTQALFWVKYTSKEGDQTAEGELVQYQLAP